MTEPFCRSDGMIKTVSGAPAAETEQSGEGVAELLLELKAQMDALRRQVTEISRRIEELKKGDD